MAAHGEQRMLYKHRARQGPGQTRSSPMDRMHKPLLGNQVRCRPGNWTGKEGGGSGGGGGGAGGKEGVGGGGNVGEQGGGGEEGVRRGEGVRMGGRE